MELKEWAELADEFTHATYDVDDDKIRLYTDSDNAYVSGEAYAGLKGEGFTRAPRQGCYFAVWRPYREDIAVILCGEIVDEESTLQERAEDRATRFAGYHDNARDRAVEHMRAGDAAVAGIPFGQPILVGHHSEGRHRRAVERAQNHATRANEELDRSDYWASRARGVEWNAARKFRPVTIANRIKKLGADKRRHEREKVNVYNVFRNWREANEEYLMGRYNVEFIWRIQPYTEASLSEGEVRLNDEDKQLFIAHLQGIVDRHKRHKARWIAHLEGQIVYWEAVYKQIAPTVKNADPGIAAQKPIEKGGWVRVGYDNEWRRVVRTGRSTIDKSITSVRVEPNPSARWDRTKYGYDEVKEYKTAEEYEAMTYAQRQEAAIAEAEKRAAVLQQEKEPDPLAEQIKAQVEAVNGIEVVVNHDPDYYPTPEPVIDRMFELLEIEKIARRTLGGKVLALEPSAGDGRIAERLRAHPQVHNVLCCELNYAAAEVLRGKGFSVVAADFLSWEALPTFGAIAMNPPFSRNQFYHHIRRAYQLLEPGGMLVSVAPRSNRNSFLQWLDEIGAYTEDLPDQSFHEEGTDHPTMLVAVSKPSEEPEPAIVCTMDGQGRLF